MWDRMWFSFCRQRQIHWGTGGRRPYTDRVWGSKLRGHWRVRIEMPPITSSLLPPRSPPPPHPAPMLSCLTISLPTIVCCWCGSFKKESGRPEGFSQPETFIFSNCDFPEFGWTFLVWADMWRPARTLTIHANCEEPKFQKISISG